MPAAFYALSFEDTGLIVGFCQLGKRDLSKPGAASALLDQLVDGKLVLSLSLSAQANGEIPKITFQKTQLSLDEVQVPDANVADFTTQPWTYLLDLSDPKAKPGDGTVKQLQLDTNKIVKPTVALTAANLTVKFTDGIASGVTLYAIIDGQADSHTVSVPVQGATEVDFTFSSTSGTYHAVLFASRGVRPTFDILRTP